MAVKVAADIEKVIGIKPEVVNSLDALEADTQVIFCATAGKSVFLDTLKKAGFTTDEIVGKREVYAIRMMENVEGVSQMLVI